MPCEFHVLVKRRKEKPNVMGSLYIACKNCAFTMGNIVPKKDYQAPVTPKDAEKFLNGLLTLINQADDLVVLKEKVFGKVNIDPS